MEFNWRSPVMTRVAILVATIFCFAYATVTKANFVLIVGLLGAIFFQVSQLVKTLERSNDNMTSFLDSIRFDDLSSSFKTDSHDPTVQRLHRELNDALAKLRSSRTERDSEYQFFKNIVQHVGIGLLTFKKDGTIQIMNTAAKRLLRVTKAETVEDLRVVSDPLVEVFLKLKTGGRELIRLKTGDESVQLSIFAIELTMRGEEVKLISMNNIQSELEEKEMEAWQNLVRVLTHEIMNSVTPISSLAGIVEEDLKHRIEKGPEAILKKDELQDMHLSLQTITKRTEGLIHFVKEFRNLTHIPAPKSTTRAPDRADVAAASSIASWPARWPVFNCRKRNRPPRKASSVHSRRRSVIGPQFMGEPGIGQELARGAIVLVVDQDAPLQEAQRALDDAHVLVQHHMMDFGAVEQRSDSGNQNEIVGSYQFPQIRSPVTAAGPLPPPAAVSIVRIVRFRQKWRPAWRLLYLSRAPRALR